MAQTQPPSQEQAPVSRREKEEARTVDALDFIQLQHDAVRQLFTDFENAVESQAWAIADEITSNLNVHTTLEEVTFYPKMLALDDKEIKKLIDDGIKEHGAVKDLIGKLQAMPADDPIFEEIVMLIRENVEHHMQEEENELFPKVRKLCDETWLHELGAELDSLDKRLRAH